MASAQTTGPRAHVLAYPGRGALSYDQITLPRSRASFGGEQHVGQTANVVVYTDGAPPGNRSAQAVLSGFDNDFSVIQAYFGGVRLKQGQQGDDKTSPRTALPIQVLMDGQVGGAYHFGCTATDLYVEPFPDAAEGFVIAQVVDLFEAAINNGWQCGQTNGEALSRVLTADRAPILAVMGISASQQWWADGHQDFITTNSATDLNNDSNGCGPLFLHYIHSQLHFDWRTITTTGGATLGETYQRLTGNSPQVAWHDFLSRLATIVDATGTLQIPLSGNPFPIGRTTTVRDQPLQRLEAKKAARNPFARWPRKEAPAQPAASTSADSVRPQGVVDARGPAAHRPAPTPTMTNPTTTTVLPPIFVSHSHADNTYCDRFVTALNSAGANVWYDRNNLGPGQMMATIQPEIHKRPVFILMLSETSLQSTWVNQEATWAYSLYMFDKKARQFLVVTASQLKSRSLGENWLFAQDLYRYEGSNMTPLTPEDAAKRALADLHS